MTFVDEIGFERNPRQLGASDVDIALRFPLELPNSRNVEVPVETRLGGVVTAVSVREKTIFSAFCQTRANSSKLLG